MRDAWTVANQASILFVGDVVGGIGRRTLLALLPALRERHAPDFVVVNGENAAGGLGITPKIADELFDAGVDVITLGNHTYRHREVYAYLDEEDRDPPAGELPAQPARPRLVRRRARRRAARRRVAVGQPVHERRRPAFSEADAALDALRGQVDHVLVDMHAEATSEKVGMGWYLDGRVTAVVGTHTHVPTADARVLPGGTAYITDVGMTGPRGGVIGVKREQAIESMVTRMPVSFETSDEDPWLNGVLIGRLPSRCERESIEQVLEPAPGIALSPARGLARRAKRRTHQHQREEPHDVQVEPVA